MARNATLDYARLVAAFGIVLFHSGAPGRSIGYAALPFFIMLLVVLALPGAAKIPFRSFAATRARRLLGPWLIWSAVYGGLKLAEVAVTGKALTAEFAPWMLLTGPAIHLWFLPFAFVTSLALHPLARLRPDPAGLGMVVSVLLGVSLVTLALQQGTALPTPLAQWLFGLPAVLLGLGFALAQGQRATLLATGAAVGLGLALALGWTQGLLQLALAGLALMACLFIRSPQTQASQLATETALGVYLAHPLIASVLERATPVTPHSLGFAVLTAGGALALTLGLNQLWPFLKNRRRDPDDAAELSPATS